MSLSARRAWIEMYYGDDLTFADGGSLSARRAWIEIAPEENPTQKTKVALRKESVDRNAVCLALLAILGWSLSARRAWIEIELRR